MTLCHIYNSSGKELLQFSTTPYERTGRITVGRSSHCDISLKAFAFDHISRTHFTLDKSMGSDWYINDCSHVGTFLNCEKIKHQKLTNGEVYRFGQLFFAFGDKTIPTPFDVCWESFDGTPQRAVIWPGTNSIGSSADNYITVREGNISRFHGHIFADNKSLTYENLHRQTTSCVNGTLVTTRIELSPGDTLMMADFPVTIEKVERVSSFAPAAASSEPTWFSQRVQASDQEILQNIADYHGEGEQKLSASAVLAILIGCLAFLGLLAGCVWYILS